MIITEDIGNRIRELRKQRKLSQEKLAEDLGLYQADVSNLERARGGSGVADLFRLDAIADYFGVSLGFLISGFVSTIEEPELPKVEKGDLFRPDYTNLSEVYRYRAMVESWVKNQAVYDTVEDYEKKKKEILKKLKKAWLMRCLKRQKSSHANTFLPAWVSIQNMYLKMSWKALKLGFAARVLLSLER